MREMTKTYFTVAYWVSLILAIFFTITIAGIVLAIPLFIAQGKFAKAMVMTDEELVKNRGSLFGWGIFLSIVLAPSVIGLIVMLIFVIMVNNQIKNIEVGATEKVEKTFEETIKEGASSTWDTVKEGSKNVWNDIKGIFAGKPELEKQKEKLEELKKMKEEGVITEEEYNAKRKQILGIE